jgi:probable rRNA maturation factor
MAHRQPAVRILHHYRGLSAPSRSLVALGARIYREHGLRPAQQTHVILCSDYVIRRLNNRFRSIDRPTDVLSFNYGEPDLLGEIYISLQRSAVQARRVGSSYPEEVRRLFVHGMCHLLGHDHESEKDRATMEQLESRYCRL